MRAESLQLLTVREVAAKLKRGPHFVYALIKSGTLKAHRRTIRGTRIPAEQLERYIAGGMTA